MTDGPVMNPDLIVSQAGELVRFGLEQEKALEMLTINPAKILGLSERIGSLEEGKDADLVIWDGDPLEYDGGVKRLLIDGEEIALS